MGGEVMVPFLVLASITPMLWGMGTAAPDANDQMVRGDKNGEFLWKYYPPGAAKRGEQGRVAFRLTVEPTGVISTCDVTESSGFKVLDDETCEIMSLYAQLKPPRNSEGRAVRAQQNGFIVWRLPPGATQLASARTKTMPKPDQMICRKDITTGSLIATTKQCMTRAEWTRANADMRDHWEGLQGRGYTNNSEASADGQ
jgi:protein TonB